jgi:hypothetical protein
VHIGGLQRGEVVWTSLRKSLSSQLCKQQRISSTRVSMPNDHARRGTFSRQCLWHLTNHECGARTGQRFAEFIVRAVDRFPEGVTGGTESLPHHPTAPD